MPIVGQDLPAGTKLRFVKDVEGCETEDVTQDRIYVVVGHDGEYGAYFYDDVGDRNFAATDDGAGLFEIV